MTLNTLAARLKNNGRFTSQTDLCLTIYVPETRLDALRIAILEHCALTYGDYDSVTFATAPGVQHFRSTGAGRNAATEDIQSVPCVQLICRLPDNDPTLLIETLKTVYAHHPYEEPVISLTPELSLRHIRGLDEDNPNRFWNQSQTEDWVPAPHR